MKTCTAAALILILFSTAATAIENTTIVTLSSKDHVFVGNNFSVDIIITPGEPVYGAEVILTFDNHSLFGSGIEKRPLLGGMAVINTVNNNNGEIWYAETLVRKVPGVRSKGVLANATFMAKKEGITSIRVKQITLVNDNGKKIMNVSYNTLNVTITNRTPAFAPFSNASGIIWIFIVIIIAVMIVRRRK